MGGLPCTVQLIQEFKTLPDGRCADDTLFRGPLIFCLLLSMFLSLRAKGEQASLVFSGVFSLVWIGEAVVTLQIKLLGGNMSVALHTCS